MFELVNALAAAENSIPLPEDRIVILEPHSVVLLSSAGGSDFPSWRDVSGLLPLDAPLFYIGNLGAKRCFAWDGDELAYLPSGFHKIPIRRFLAEFPLDRQTALCRARGICSWRKKHLYCGVCRSTLIPSVNDSGVKCSVCGEVYYPQLAPAVIVGITRNNGRELLLAHNRNFAGNMYSLIAGFVESGESVESAVFREIYEECSIKVKNIEYITSQVWPFPNSLMLAFRAEYESGNACADGEELTDLGWFTADDHPELPSPGSVARKVIDQIFSNIG